MAVDEQLEASITSPVPATLAVEHQLGEAAPAASNTWEATRDAVVSQFEELLTPEDKNFEAIKGSLEAQALQALTDAQNILAHALASGDDEGISEYTKLVNDAKNCLDNVKHARTARSLQAQQSVVQALQIAVSAESIEYAVESSHHTSYFATESVVIVTNKKKAATPIFKPSAALSATVAAVTKGMNHSVQQVHNDRDGDGDDAVDGETKRLTQQLLEDDAKLTPAERKQRDQRAGTVKGQVATAKAAAKKTVAAVMAGDEDAARAEALKIGRGTRRTLIDLGVNEEDAQNIAHATRQTVEAVAVTAVTINNGIQGAAKGTEEEAHELQDDLGRRGRTAQKIAANTLTAASKGDWKGVERNSTIAVVAVARNIQEAPQRAAKSADDIWDATQDKIALGSKFGRELNGLLGVFQRDVKLVGIFDQDKDGKIELHEMKNVLKDRFGIDSISDVDDNKDGHISQAELMAHLPLKKPTSRKH